MPATRVSMRKTREILRLRWGLQRSLRETAASCGLGATTVQTLEGQNTSGVIVP